jgi:hypothetical protein
MIGPADLFCAEARHEERPKAILKALILETDSGPIFYDARRSPH